MINAVIIEGQGVDIKSRPFDHNFDVRAFTLEEAIEKGNERASVTGVRQIVRQRQAPDRTDDNIIPRYYVQAL